MNSIPWIGKIVGCFIIEPLIDRVGYRQSIVVASIIQIIALIIEMTAKGWQQFTIGRNFAYLSVGLVSGAAAPKSKFVSNVDTNRIPPG